MTLLIVFAGLGLLTLIGLPIAFALGAIGLFGILSGQLPLMSVPLMTINIAETYVLVAVPMFMLMGLLVEKAGLGQIIIDFAGSTVGWLRGGLAHVNVIDSLLFGGISGSSASDVASLGTIIIPEMARKGYPKNFAAALTASTSELAVLIPPSIPAIVYGVLANVSIAKMFLAGIFPGLILAALFMAINHTMAVRNQWPILEPFSVSRVATMGVKAAPALTIPFVILGGILSGVFTATESAAVAVGIAVVLTFVVYRTVSWAETWELLVLTCRRTAVIMLIVAASGTLGWYLADRQVPQELATQLLSLTHDPILIRILLGLFLILLGTMMSGMPMMILMVPVMMPILPMINMDPIQFGVTLVVAGAIGSQTPPVAATMLLTCVIAEVTVEEMWQANRWFILATTIVLFLVMFFPALSLTLPRLLG